MQIANPHPCFTIATTSAGSLNSNQIDLCNTLTHCLLGNCPQKVLSTERYTATCIFEYNAWCFFHRICCAMRNVTTLFQVMFACRQATSHDLSQRWETRQNITLRATHNWQNIFHSAEIWSHYHVTHTPLASIQISNWIHDDVIKWKHFLRYWPFVRGIHRSSVNSPHRPVTRSFDVFFDLHLDKLLSKQSWGWWFKT